MRLACWMHTTAIQAFVQDLALMGEFSGIRLLPSHNLLLSILHILKYFVNNEMDTYLRLLISPHLRRMWHALAPFLLLGGGKLLVGRWRKTALAERQQHLR